MADAPVSGTTQAGFETVRDIFAKSLADGEDLGANFAAFVEGERVVDLVGGHLDQSRRTPWTKDRLARIYSSGKAVIAMLVARAASEGAIDYEAPVAAYWPEFGAAGKSDITVAEALSHQAGLCGIPDEMQPLEWLDWEKICARIAAMAPVAPPRRRSAYGPQIFGFVAGEILRRATGRSIRDMLREDFHDALGVNIFCGLPADEMRRAAPMQKPPRAPDYGDINLCTELAFLKPWSAPSRLAPEALMAANIPASNMYADARALAELAQPLAYRGEFRRRKILSAAAIEAALKERIRGDDLVLPFNLSWAAGVLRNTNGHFGPSKTAFGHAGWGGSAVMFDPERGLSAAYLMNKMSPHLAGDPRAVRLFAALYRAL